jgi:hypothetical protein
MTDPTSSPFRLLVNTYINNVITREQYVKTRSQLLKKLQSNGRIDNGDLNEATLISQDTPSPKTERSYSSSDWIIIILGLTASVALAYILYE